MTAEPLQSQSDQQRGRIPRQRTTSDAGMSGTLPSSSNDELRDAASEPSGAQAEQSDEQSDRASSSKAERALEWPSAPRRDAPTPMAVAGVQSGVRPGSVDRNASERDSLDDQSRRGGRADSKPATAETAMQRQIPLGEHSTSAPASNASPARDERRADAPSSSAQSSQSSATGAGVPSPRSDKARAMFDQLDLNKDGTVELSELRSTLQDLGLKASEEQLASMMRVVSKQENQSLQIDLGDFLAYLDSISDADWQQLDLESLVADVWLLEADTRHVTKPAEVAKTQSSTAWKYLAAGGIAGAVSRTVTSPLELAKILYQVHPQRYTGLADVFTQVYRDGGVKAFWRGNGANVVRIAPYSAIQFSSYEAYTKWFLAPGQSDISVMYRLTAGALAGVTATMCTYPLDLIRTRLSVHQQEYKGIWDGMRSVFQKGGVSALYRGWFPTVAGIAPYVGINFTLYDALKKRMLTFYQASDSLSKPSLPVHVSLTCGALAGAGALTVTYPLDVMRRRCHLSMEGYQNLIQFTLQIARREGWKSLYSGLAPCYLKVMPAMAVNFVVYEAMKKVMKIA
ncbi:grave disease carrier protein [Capsaspora owczarzaki ATCC 30864]|uniref:grave disease carrier protein n=1 Tax=Capsaspora owczarzaki (strain ATCC 30864) TaxID=595528 RepID=UPI00035245F3|nr:grave disease carrier protein [Capsaspora owczarzaki ATCC 30864]|eukprot:XP_004349707.2 grave disease carrier protein [Capsaspora owczarzaki ATCC 30864]